MKSLQSEKITEQTIAWINSVVIDCNFCPFAKRAMEKKSVKYMVLSKSDLKESLDQLAIELEYLDEHENIETTFIIFEDDYKDFTSYLELVDDAEDLLIEADYEGIYQLASFHPQYIFADAAADDAANYTNRSPYPMLHLLRESSIDAVLKNYKHPDQIPINNMEYARTKGLEYMQLLRAACMK